MPKSVTIKEFQARLDAIPKAVREAVKAALIKSAEELADRVRYAAPKDTGALAASVAVTLPGETTPAHSQPGGSRTAGPLETIVTVGNSAVRYPHFPEFGTVDAPANPYFWPTVRITEPRADARVRRAVNKAVNDEWNKQ